MTETRIISVDEALSSGTTPVSLEMIARWHDVRANDVSRALKAGRKPFGEEVTEADVKRHKDTVAELRVRAKEIRKAAN